MPVESHRTPEEWACLIAEDQRTAAPGHARQTDRNNWDWDRIIAQDIDPARTIPHGDQA